MRRMTFEMSLEASSTVAARKVVRSTQSTCVCIFQRDHWAAVLCHRRVTSCSRVLHSGGRHSLQRSGP